MAKRMFKNPLFVAACIGGMVLGCGCPCGMPNLCNPCALVTPVLTYVAGEFLMDNDAVFDLFQDDFGTGALYDDRNTAAPTRAEP